jgi:hypothetical protein
VLSEKKAFVSLNFHSIFAKLCLQIQSLSVTSFRFLSLDAAKTSILNRHKQLHLKLRFSSMIAICSVVSSYLKF